MAIETNYEFKDLFPDMRSNFITAVLNRTIKVTFRLIVALYNHYRPLKDFSRENADYYYQDLIPSSLI